jgi:hypothetical protein
VVAVAKLVESPHETGGNFLKNKKNKMNYLNYALMLENKKYMGSNLVNEGEAERAKFLSKRLSDVLSGENGGQWKYAFDQLSTKIKDTKGKKGWHTAELFFSDAKKTPMINVYYQRDDNGKFVEDSLTWDERKKTQTSNSDSGSTATPAAGTLKEKALAISKKIADLFDQNNTKYNGFWAPGFSSNREGWSQVGGDDEAQFQSIFRKWSAKNINAGENLTSLNSMNASQDPEDVENYGAIVKALAEIDSRILGDIAIAQTTDTVTWNINTGNDDQPLQTFKVDTDIGEK